jgi:hypothetical protein
MSHNQQLFGALVKRSYIKCVEKLCNVVKKRKRKICKMKVIGKGCVM